MVRPYGTKLLDVLENNDGLGADLARICTNAKLPMLLVGKALGVSRYTIYKWFLGMPMAKKRNAVIEAFISKVAADMEAGRLPAKSPEDAKAYFNETKNAV